MLLKAVLLAVTPSGAVIILKLLGILKSKSNISIADVSKVLAL